MKTKPKQTLQSLINNSYLPETLIRSVVRQSGGWQRFREIAPDVSRHGASGGFGGWIYYPETLAFTRRNLKAIRQALADLARDLGESGPLAVVSGFNCLKGATEEEIAGTLYGNGNEDTQVGNALAWFALEETCNAFENLNP